MPEFVQGLFRADFLPHGWCYRWDPGVVWLHVVSDLLISLAYYLIPFGLIHIVRRRGDLVYPWMFWLFGAFILACGTTHLMSVFVVWWPWYRFDGVVKLVTAAVSVPTAIALLRVAPAVISLPSPEQLRIMNRQLEHEVGERKAAEQEVRTLNAELERRVEERTRELQHANQQLRASEKRLHAILDSSPTLVYLKGPDGRYQFINRRFEQAFGTSRAAVLGRGDHEIFPEDLAETYRSADEEVLREGSPREYEEPGIQDGDVRTYASVKFPLVDEAGATYALCGFSTDITEKKRAEQELRQYNAELEQFAFIAAHDLQEPLRTVKTYVQLLKKRYSARMDADADEFIGFIVGGVDRMQDLIRGLQSLTDLNRRERVVARIDSGRVLHETLRSMQITIEEAGLQVTNDDLPVVRVDRGQLGQLFQNLISNAIKYRSDKPPHVHVSARKTGRAWEFSVKDNGIGLDMKYASQIFRVFRRLHGNDVPGTGIGLAVCTKIVETHGGTLWVESAPGAGADFRFTLPE